MLFSDSEVYFDLIVSDCYFIVFIDVVRVVVFDGVKYLGVIFVDAVKELYVSLVE